MGLLLYVDPGSGSIILQIVIAGGLALSIYIKQFFNKIKYFTRRIRGGDDE